MLNNPSLMPDVERPRLAELHAQAAHAALTRAVEAARTAPRALSRTNAALLALGALLSHAGERLARHATRSTLRRA